jgi:hypothetical protein
MEDEYFVALVAEELTAAMARFEVKRLARNAQPGQSDQRRDQRCGGVGTSTIAANLAGVLPKPINTV